jgi:hypothetical protein
VARGGDDGLEIRLCDVHDRYGAFPASFQGLRAMRRTHETGIEVHSFDLEARFAQEPKRQPAVETTTKKTQHPSCHV